VPLKAGVFGATVPTADEVQAFLSVVSDPARRPVFVHCKRGRDRTGVMVALWRVAQCGWSPEAAIAEMNERGMSAHYRNYRRFIRSLHGVPADA
jgi:protein-tyrosine phosphatase